MSGWSSYNGQHDHTMSERTAHTALIALTLALALALVIVSAFVRHVNAGLGESFSSGPYGAIGTVEAPAQHAPEWAVGAHRILASTLGLTVIGLVGLAAWRGRPREWKALTALTVVTVGLAALGLRSATLHEPAVVVANAMGGVALVALAARLLYPRIAPGGMGFPSTPALRTGALLLLALLIGQTTLGFLVSANFAGLACPTPSGCARPWALWDHLALAWTALQVDAQGMALRTGALEGLHMAHRIIGLVTAAAAGMLAGLAWQHGLRIWSGVLIMAAGAALATGFLSVVFGLELQAVLGHYLLALAMVVWIIPLCLPVSAEYGHGT